MAIRTDVKEVTDRIAIDLGRVFFRDASGGTEKKISNLFWVGQVENDQEHCCCCCFFWYCGSCLMEEDSSFSVHPSQLELL